MSQLYTSSRIGTVDSRVWRGRELLLYATVVLIYLATRLLLIPAQAELTNAFSHDSGYLALLAENLAAGRGYVNDALWLVFLMPPTLPMPYHNANPLFPTLVAGLSGLTGDVFRSGFILAALASGLLLCATIALLRPVTRTAWEAVALSLPVVLFPPVLADSFFYLTDALCAALQITFIAILVRTQSLSACLAAGAVLGLAWLTRSATILIVPAVAMYLVLRLDIRTAAVRLAAIALAACVIASPWLIHTKRVWGTYLRSDSGYSMVQDLAARKSHQNSVMRFWHSTQKPPSVTTFIQESPADFAKHTMLGLINVLKRTVAWWGQRSVPITLAIFAAVLVWGLDRRRWWTPEAAALMVFATTTVVALAIRGQSFEERYVNTLTILVALFTVLGCWRAWQRASRLRVAVATALTVIWAVIIPMHIYSAYTDIYRPNPALAEYRRASAEVDRRFAKGAPVVVGTEPYFYSLETRSPSLNFPDAPDSVLLNYMDKYGASHVFLTRAELQFWRPSWNSPSSLPDGLSIGGKVGDGIVFERTSQPHDAAVKSRGMRSQAP